EKTDSRIRNRRQIAESDLDHEPGRAPNGAKREPRCGYAPAGFRLRMASWFCARSSHRHCSFKRRTATWLQVCVKARLYRIQLGLRFSLRQQCLRALLSIRAPASDT